MRSLLNFLSRRVVPAGRSVNTRAQPLAKERGVLALLGKNSDFPSAECATSELQAHRPPCVDGVVALDSSPQREQLSSFSPHVKLNSVREQICDPWLPSPVVFGGLNAATYMAIFGVRMDFPLALGRNISQAVHARVIEENCSLRKTIAALEEELEDVRDDYKYMIYAHEKLMRERE